MALGEFDGFIIGINDSLELGMLFVGAGVNMMEGLLLETTGVDLMVDIMLGAVLVKLLGWTLGMTVGIDVSWVGDCEGDWDG